MKRIALLSLAAMLAVASSEAQARHHHHHWRHHHWARHHYAHHWAYHGLSEACRRAAAMGGPCGCVAAEILFGRPDRNLWTVSSWMRFPRSSPGPGKAAVWPHRHVEAIVRANGDGTLTTNGPYGIRRVRLASVVVVDPHH